MSFFRRLANCRSLVQGSRLADAAIKMSQQKSTYSIPQPPIVNDSVTLTEKTKSVASDPTHMRKVKGELLHLMLERHQVLLEHYTKMASQAQDEAVKVAPVYSTPAFCGEDVEVEQFWNYLKRVEMQGSVEENRREVEKHREAIFNLLEAHSQNASGELSIEKMVLLRAGGQRKTTRAKPKITSTA